MRDPRRWRRNRFDRGIDDQNIARLDADEVVRWETFTLLVREGRSLDDIASMFGLPELVVKRALVLGNLLPAIRRLYAAERIDAATARRLTLASTLTHNPRPVIRRGAVQTLLEHWFDKVAMIEEK